MLQTVGASHPRLDGVRQGIAAVVAAAIILGNISMPVAVMAGWLRDDRPPRAMAAQAAEERR
jgi:hypothetical protein